MSVIDIVVPDIGDFAEVEVIEILVKPGDTVSAEQSLITVESDKASMEIPSAGEGVIESLAIKVGDKVSKGTVIGKLAPAAGPQDGPSPQAGAPAAAPAQASSPASTPPRAPAASAPAGGGGGEATASLAPAIAASPAPAPAPASTSSGQREHPVPADMHEGALEVKPHASPSVRKFARELGADLARIEGSGRKGRITEDDVKAFVKAALGGSGGGMAATGTGTGGASGQALGLIPWPKVDFEKFGPIETRPLARIRKISGANLHRNWVMIPHVTNHDDADITDLEAFRVAINAENAKSGVKLTMLAFLIKACVAALKAFPEFNASLDGESVVYKRYFHIGFAADTPNGLMVPVIRDADRKGINEIASETAALAAKARDGKLSPAEMQGGCFSISSLGGIGGTYFTPIINAPEVAILGVCRSVKRPVWNEQREQFEPRLILPLSLSWDHRVIDGAAAARFNTFLARILADYRRIVL
ncbi:MAG: dihydrolipoyllysine-residue acetyltransferase [Lautropia sp.]